MLNKHKLTYIKEGKYRLNVKLCEDNIGFIDRKNSIPRWVYRDTSKLDEILVINKIDTKDRMHIYYIQIVKEYRGCGYFKYMLSDFINSIELDGFKSVTLLSKEELKHLYVKSGFKELAYLSDIDYYLLEFVV